MAVKNESSISWLDINESTGNKSGDCGLSAISKKALSGEDAAIQRSNLIDADEQLYSSFAELSVLEPSLRPTLLVRWYQLSSVLQQLIACMVQNVVGAGYRLEQTIDLDSKDGWETVKTSMMLRALDEAEADADENGEKATIDIAEPNESDINAEVEWLKKLQWQQKATAKRFLRNCNAKLEITDILEQMDTERENVGWGVIEVRRDGRGRPARLDHGRSWTFRGKPLDDPIETDIRVQTSDVDWSVERDDIAFRRFVQFSPSTGKHRYFKEYSDPRVVSSKSGTIYEDTDQLEREEPGIPPATELLWFPLQNPESSIYGLPRFSGNINSVVGSYHMETVNILFFRDKAIPPLVVMVSGGHLGAKLKEELKVAIRDHIKGTENFHGILVIEAEPARGGSALTGTAGQNQVKVEFKPLTEAFFTEQLFGEYDQANRDKVRQAYRIPKLLVGDTDKINRATAETAVQYAEAQIFQSDRRKIESPINRILRDLGVTMWRFELQKPTMASSMEMLEKIAKLAEVIITPEEGRMLAAKVLGEEFDKLEGDWMHVPIKYFLSGVRPPTSENRVDEETSETLDEITGEPPRKK